MATPICAKCEIDPKSHSFSKIGVHDGASVFYTCPAEAKLYDDTEGILKHYDAMLSLHHPNPWIWIFDSKNFSSKHALEVRTGIGLATMISKKYASSLQKIVVLHPTWHIRVMLNIVWPFLSDSVIQSIEARDDK